MNINIFPWCGSEFKFTNLSLSLATSVVWGNLAVFLWLVFASHVQELSAGTGKPGLSSQPFARRKKKKKKTKRLSYSFWVFFSFNKLSFLRWPQSVGFLLFYLQCLNSHLPCAFLPWLLLWHFLLSHEPCLGSTQKLCMVWEGIFSPLGFT